MSTIEKIGVELGRLLSYRGDRCKTSHLTIQLVVKDDTTQLTHHRGTQVHKNCHAPPGDLESNEIVIVSRRVRTNML